RIDEDRASCRTPPSQLQPSIRARPTPRPSTSAIRRRTWKARCTSTAACTASASPPTSTGGSRTTPRTAPTASHARNALRAAASRSVEARSSPAPQGAPRRSGAPRAPGAPSPPCCPASDRDARVDEPVVGALRVDQPPREHELVGAPELLGRERRGVLVTQPRQ